jgi:hypothetical protein
MRARYFMVFAMVLSFAMVALADDGPPATEVGRCGQQ